ncbi:MAG: hypothetical protein E7561_05715 [Ruminococcaceae bacterium]|nr:hypothetical protein [Oscillospiraceae bacterium]
MKKLLSLVLTVLLVFTTIIGASTVEAENLQTAYINGDYVNIRTEPSPVAVSLGKVSFDNVTLLGETAQVQGMEYLWYKIQYGSITGWLYGHPEWFAINTPPSTPTPESNATFEEQLKAFPESYHQALRELHEMYPNWKFVADNIDFTFDKAVDEQYLNYRKYVELSQGIAWRSLRGEAYNWQTDKWKIYDSDRWVAASREVVAYYMDPRNFLNRSSVYMFLNQSYDTVNHTEAGLSKIIAGTFLVNNYTPNPNSQYDVECGGSYSKVIMLAAKESGVSPYIIASKIIVEQGDGTSSLISGNYPGFEGYYNFFNWGAFGVGNDVIIRNGLTTAKSEGWNSRAASIIGGAKKLADGYIENRQHTYYYMAFNVLNQNYNHQYESAIYAAYNKAQNMSTAYATNYEAPLVFNIPVYTSIPNEVATKAERYDNRYNNYYLTQMNVGGLSPEFSMFNQSYSLNVSGDTTIYVELPDKASIISETKTAINAGENNIIITVKAESGFTNTYNINVTAAKPSVITVDTGIHGGTCGSNINWKITNNGTLKIGGTGATDGYTVATATPWYDYSAEITTVEIAETVTNIGNFNFYSLENLENVIVNNPDMTFGKRVFKTGTDVVIHAKGGSSVEEYARENSITFIKPQNPETPKAPELLYRSGYSVILQTVEGYEYSIDGINWQQSGVFEDLNAGTTYNLYQRIADGVYAPSAKSEALIVTTLLAPTAPTVESVDGQKVTLTKIDGYQYSMDGKVWQESNVFLTVPFDKILCFYQRKMANGSDLESPTSAATKISVISAPKVFVGFDTLKIVYTEGYEYSYDGKTWQDSNFFEVLDGEYYTLYHRPKNIDGIAVFANETTTVFTNGRNIIENPVAEDLVWLKKRLLLLDGQTNLAADVNSDGVVNILDYISMQKKISK